MDKRRLFFPIFVLRLTLANALFFSSMLFIPIRRHKLLLLSLFILSIYLLFFGKYLIIKDEVVHSPTKIFNVKERSNQIVTFEDFNKISQFEDKINGLRKVSPDNRNILLNLALLKYYQNEVDSYQKLWTKATALDPNSPLFTNL